MESNFEKLNVYKKAIDLSDEAYSLTKSFPKEEIFGLTSQMRRATVSIALNLAEGSVRTKKEFCRYIDISRGSGFESIAILEISLRQKYITDEQYKDFRGKITGILKMLSGLKKSLKA